MSLKYIFGGSGTGKTEICLSEITSEAKKNENNMLLYIVPEQFSMQSEKELVIRSGEKSILRMQVLSFNRLGYHVFSETGKIPEVLLDETGKNMLLRKITLLLSKELKYFNKVLDKQGFIENLSETITEFYKYNVTSEDILKYLEKVRDREGLYLKMQDILKIFDVFGKYISGKYVSIEQALDFVPEKIERSSFLENALVWIDGFNGFTIQEYNIISKLLKKVTNVTVALTIKDKEILYNDLKVTDYFFETKNTVNNISKLAYENNVKIEQPIFLQSFPRFKEFPEMCALESNYFSYKKNIYTDNVSNIEINVSSNIYGEITYVCNKIINLIQQENYRYFDIAVVMGNISTYEEGIRSIFKLYDIPFFLDTKTEIISHPLSELIRSALDIIIYNFNYESVFRFLKTSMTHMSETEMFKLENYVLAYGIKSYKWKKEWEYGFEKGIYDKEKINNSRLYLLNQLAPLSDNFNNTKKYTVKEISTKIFEILFNLEVPKTLDSWKDETGSKVHLQVWNKICDLIDKMVEILGEEKVNIKEFSKILEAGLKQCNVGLIPPSLDQVVIGDFERTRLPKIKALFVIGVNDGVLPAPKDESGLFDDEEREIVTSLGLELAPSSRRKSYEQQFLIYCGLTKPENYLSLSFSEGTLEGKGMKPSIIISKLKSIFSNLTENRFEYEISVPKQMFYDIGVAIKNFKYGEEINSIQKDIYNWFSKNELYKYKLEKIEKIVFTNEMVKFLKSDTVKKLYGKEIITGISRLEKYVECPFAYFIKYNLLAKERQVYEVQPVDMGNLFHDTLYEFSKQLEEKKLTFRDVNEKIINDTVDYCIENLTHTIKNDVFTSSAKYKYVIQRIKRISKKSIWALSEHIKSGDFNPVGAELEFKDGTPITGIAISINENQKFILTGKIDRIDIMNLDGNKYVKIIDYKSGNKKFDINDVYFGMQLQLLLYIDAFIKNGVQFFGKENINFTIKAGGVFYFNIDDPIIEYNEDIVHEKLQDMILESFKMTGLVLGEMEVVKGMDKNINGSSKIIPVGIKKTGEFSSRSSIVSEEEFNKMREYVTTKIQEIGNNIVSGNINPYPYKKGNITACDYCDYSAICQIDLKEEKDKFNSY